MKKTIQIFLTSLVSLILFNNNITAAAQCGLNSSDNGQGSCNCNEGYEWSSTDLNNLDCKPINYHFLKIEDHFSNFNVKSIDDIKNVPGYLLANKNYKYFIHKDVGFSSYRKGEKSELACSSSSDRLMFNIDDKDNVTIYCAPEEKITYPKFGINNTSYFGGEEVEIIGYNFDKEKSYYSLGLVNKDGSAVLNNSGFPVEVLINQDSIEIEKNGDYMDDKIRFTIPLEYPINGSVYHLFKTDVKTVRFNMFYRSCIPEISFTDTINLQNFCGYTYYRQFIDIPLKADDSDPVSLNQYYLGNLNIEKVWEKYGKDLNEVVVAYLDDGVGFSSNPDFDGKIYINKNEIPGNGIDDDGNGYIDDVNGWNFVGNNNNLKPYGEHGTNGAGLIAAKHNNNYGIKGIAPNVKIMPLTVCANSGCSDNSIYNAMKYAIENGADIINMSLGGPYTKDYDKYIELAKKNNVIIVVAGGNHSENTSKIKVSPVCNGTSRYDIIGVGATGQDGKKLPWSAYGRCVDVWAPGDRIFTSPVGYGYTQYADTQGTSFSSPITAGIVALGMGLNNTLNSKEIINLLKENTSSNITTGYNQIDAYRYIKDLIKTHGKEYNEKNRSYNNSGITTLDIQKEQLPIKTIKKPVPEDTGDYEIKEYTGNVFYDLLKPYDIRINHNISKETTVEDINDTLWSLFEGIGVVKNNSLSEIGRVLFDRAEISPESYNYHSLSLNNYINGLYNLSIIENYEATDNKVTYGLLYKLITYGLISLTDPSTHIRFEDGTSAFSVYTVADLTDKFSVISGLGKRRFITVAENKFTDTDATSQEGKAANYLSEQGIIGGYSDGTFKGGNNVNRAEAAKFLILAGYGSNFSTSYYTGNLEFKTLLSDVDQDQWYAGYVNKAVMDGIINGYGDGSFKPGNQVNTAEFLKMLSKTFKLQSYQEHSFTDVKEGDWFNEYAGIAKKYSLFPDRGNQLNPGKTLTRKEVAIAIYNYLQKK